MLAVLLPAALFLRGAEAPAEQKKLRTALFVDEGCRGSGVLLWARMLAYSPQIDFTMVNGEDLRNGKLDGIDLLVVPGGSSEVEVKRMGEAGADAVRKFVAAGGRYFGICAGFHCVLDRPNRLRLLPFAYRKGAGGHIAGLSMELSAKGAKLLGVRPGRYMVHYSRGPISKQIEPTMPAWGEVLGVFKSTVSLAGGRGGDFLNAPAVIRGEYGKGKVIATSFHPENHADTRELGLGCIWAVTGVRPTPVYPAKMRRPLRVGYYALAIGGPKYIADMLELDKDPRLDVQLIDYSHLADGVLEHLDVMIFPHGGADRFKFLDNPFCRNAFADFMARGGRIVVTGSGAKYIPEHKNLTVLPVGSSFLAETLREPGKQEFRSTL